MAFCDLALVVRLGSGLKDSRAFPDSRGRRHRPHFIMGGILVNMWPCFKNITPDLLVSYLKTLILSFSFISPNPLTFIYQLLSAGLFKFEKCLLFSIIVNLGKNFITFHLEETS